jgi:hypothetical protein
VLVVQPGRRHRCDEKLRSVRAGSSVGHRHREGAVMSGLHKTQL